MHMHINVSIRTCHTRIYINMCMTHQTNFQTTPSLPCFWTQVNRSDPLLKIAGPKGKGPKLLETSGSQAHAEVDQQESLTQDLDFEQAQAVHVF